MNQLHINCTMDGPHVRVEVGGDERTYADMETFVAWLSQVHTRLVSAGRTARITTDRTPNARAVAEEDLYLRDCIGASSVGHWLA